MYDKREWLAERGLAKAGKRGKFSKAAHEALEAAEKAGTVFIQRGTTTSTVTVMVDGEATQEVRAVDPYAPHADPIRTGTLTFKGKDRKHVKVNASEACHKCRYSFGWCYCDVPTYHYWKTQEDLTIVE